MNPDTSVEALHLLISARPGERVGESPHAVWCDAVTARAERVHPFELAALERLQSLDTPQDHARRLARELRVDVALADRVLANLRARGLVATLATMLPAADAPLGSEPPLLAIKTHRRPEALALLLAGLDADASRWGVCRDVVVVDDSADSAEEARTREIAARAGRADRLSIRVFGSAEREPLLARFERSLDAEQRRVLRDMLCPRTNRSRNPARGTNWTVLLGAGRAMAPLDDDVYLPVRVPPWASARLDLRNRVDSTHRFDVGPDAFGALPEADADPLVAGCALIGCSPRTLATRFGVDARLAGGLPVADWIHLLRPSARVLATAQGHYGPLDADHASYLGYHDAESLAELWRDDGGMAGRSVLTQVPAPRLTSRAFMLPQLVDQRELTPFSGSTGSVDDTLWLAMIAAVAGDPLFATLPHAIGHCRVRERNRDARILDEPGIDPDEFVADWLFELGAAMASQDRALRLATIGRFAADLAGADDLQIADQVRRWHQVRLAEHQRRLEHALQLGEGRAPESWRGLVESVLSGVLDRMAECPGVPESVAGARSTLHRIAVAAEFWPELWESVRRAA